MSDDRRGRQPISLGDDAMPDERRQRIEEHVAMLSETARQVSDTLAFGADVSELTGVLEGEADKFSDDGGRS